MTFTLYLFAAHFLGDWPLQSNHMAANKLTDPVVRGMHVAVYTLVFTPLALSAWSRRTAGVFLGALAVSHYVIDSRRWYEPVEGFESRPIWFDQAFHIVALAGCVALANLRVV